MSDTWFRSDPVVPPQCLSVRLQPTPNGAGVRQLVTETTSRRPRCQPRGSCCGPTVTTTYRSASTSSPRATGRPDSSSTNTTRPTCRGSPSRVTHSLAPLQSIAACHPSCSSRCPAAAPMATWWCGPWGGGRGAARRPSAGSGRR